MVKKLVSLILCTVMAIGGCIGFASCSKNSQNNDADLTKQEAIEELVDYALDEADIRIEDYIDVSHFVNLAETNQSTVRSSVKQLTHAVEARVDAEQYEALTSSISGIFSELTDEEYETVKTLAESDGEIAEMLEMVENDFADYGYETDNSEYSISAAKVALTSTAVVTIGSILLGQGVGGAAVVAIKGAFNTMLATLKAFFVPTTIKAVIVTAAILVISTVVIINWNKIKPVFNRIVNIFVDNAKKLASTVANVFNKIFATAVAATAGAATVRTFEDVINQDKSLKDELSNTKKSIVKNILKKFLRISNFDDFYDSEDKVLCIGRDDEKTYKNSNDLRGYQNYADKYGYWCFFVQDYEKQLEKYGQKLIDIANEVLVRYCCLKDWNFILVTNPYHYMAEHKSTKYGGYAYAKEIEIIRKHNYNVFLSGPISWANVPYPGNTEDSYFAFAGYEVTK